MTGPSLQEGLSKPAMADYELHPLLLERWSPRAFSPRPVEPAKLCSLVEAARWAPSCFNEQPWRYFVGVKGEDPIAFEELASLLVSGNDWAKEAPVLLLSVAQKAFTHNGKPNRHAVHDVGLATAMMVIQAQSMGLITHQMAGFEEEKAYDVLGIPRDTHEAVAMMALGYPGNPDTLPEALRQREQAPRERRPLQSMVFSRAWDAAYPVCFT